MKPIMENAKNFSISPFVLIYTFMNCRTNYKLFPKKKLFCRTATFKKKMRNNT